MPIAATQTRIRKSRSERLNLRLSADQAKLIRLAARETQATLSAFLLESACIRAHEALASQRHLVYNAKQWNAFATMLDRPTQDKPRLRRLLNEPSILERRKAAK